MFNYSAGVKKSTATTVGRKGLREGHVLSRRLVLKERSRLSWQEQQNKSLEPTACAAA